MTNSCVRSVCNERWNALVADEIAPFRASDYTALIKDQVDTNICCVLSQWKAPAGEQCPMRLTRSSIQPCKLDRSSSMNAQSSGTSVVSVWTCPRAAVARATAVEHPLHATQRRLMHTLSRMIVSESRHYHVRPLPFSMGSFGRERPADVIAVVALLLDMEAIPGTGTGAALPCPRCIS